MTLRAAIFVLNVYQLSRGYGQKVKQSEKNLSRGDDAMGAEGDVTPKCLARVERSRSC